jgi:hypothetical protein
MRKIARSVYESALDVAHDVAKTDGYKQSRKDRKKVGLTETAARPGESPVSEWAIRLTQRMHIYPRSRNQRL